MGEEYMNKMLLCFFMWVAVTPLVIMAQDHGEISFLEGIYTPAILADPFNF